MKKYGKYPIKNRSPPAADATLAREKNALRC